MVDIEQVAHWVRQHGPDRVVFNEAGEAKPWRKAFRDHRVVADVVFIRRDGWTLGAPRGLEAIAESLWGDEWIGVCSPGQLGARTYREYLDGNFPLGAVDFPARPDVP